MTTELRWVLYDRDDQRNGKVVDCGRGLWELATISALHAEGYIFNGKAALYLYEAEGKILKRGRKVSRDEFDRLVALGRKEPPPAGLEALLPLAEKAAKGVDGAALAYQAILTDYRKKNSKARNGEDWQVEFDAPVKDRGAVGACPWYWVGRLELDSGIAPMVSYAVDMRVVAKRKEAIVLGTFATQQLAENAAKLVQEANKRLVETRVVDIRKGTYVQLQMLLQVFDYVRDSTLVNKGDKITKEDVVKLVKTVGVTNTQFMNLADRKEIPVTEELSHSNLLEWASDMCGGDIFTTVDPSEKDPDPYKLRELLDMFLGLDEDCEPFEEEEDEKLTDGPLNPTAQKPTQWPMLNRRPWEWLFASYCQAPETRTLFREDVLACAKDPCHKPGITLALSAVLQNQVREVRGSEGLGQAFVAARTMHMDAAVRFVASGKVILEPTPELADSMMHTKLSVPLKHVGAPFRTVYIDVSKYAPLMLRDSPGLEGYLMGCYASMLPARIWSPDGRLYRSDWGSLVPKKELDGDADTVGKTLEELGIEHLLVIDAVFGVVGREPMELHTVPFYLGDETFEEVQGRVKVPLVVSDSTDAAVRECEAKDTREAHLLCTRLVCGLFLYMSNPELKSNVRPSMYGRHDEAIRGFRKGQINQAGQALLTGGKHSVLKIGATASMRRNAAVQAELTGKSVRAHWRAGHWHLYWTGPGRTVPVVKLLEAVLVNAKQLGVGQEVKPSNYKVK